MACRYWIINKSPQFVYMQSKKRNETADFTDSFCYFNQHFDLIRLLLTDHCFEVVASHSCSQLASIGLEILGGKIR